MEKNLDLRIQKTYLALHNALTSILERNHFEDFTVNELCDCAMIRRTTFYKHFADKYDYFTFYLREITQAQIAPEGSPEADPDAYFFEICRNLLRFSSQHARIVENVLNSNMFPVLFDILLQNATADIVHLLKTVFLPTTLSQAQLEEIATFYSGGLLNTLYRWLKQQGQCSAQDEEQFLSTIVLIVGRTPISQLKQNLGEAKAAPSGVDPASLS